MALVKSNPPLEVQVTRGDAVESVHRVDAVAVDAQGAVVACWGNGDAAVYPRSAAKPIQAIPLIETGAAARFRLSDAELALACASHNGEPRHVDAVGGWLARLGLSAAALECGPHRPIDEASSDALVRRGAKPSALHNNCSGKHTGFLTACVHKGDPTKGYIRAEHAAQRRVLKALTEMTGATLGRAPKGTDGCGIPVVAAPLQALARALARMADPGKLDSDRAAACRRIVAAMAAHPEMVAGRARFDTDAICASGGRFVTKGGAEGVHGAIMPVLGIGVALKAGDGAKRAASAAMAWVLRDLGALDSNAEAALDGYLDGPVLNVAGNRVGSIRVNGNRSNSTRRSGP